MRCKCTAVTQKPKEQALTFQLTAFLPHCWQKCLERVLIPLHLAASCHLIWTRTYTPSDLRRRFSPTFRGYSLGILPVSSYKTGQNRGVRLLTLAGTVKHNLKRSPKQMTLTASPQTDLLKLFNFLQELFLQQFFLLLEFKGSSLSFCSSLTSESWEPGGRGGGEWRA